MRQAHPRALLAALAVAMAATACTGSTTTGPAANLPAASGTRSLKDACPPTVVVQTNWHPQAEHSAAYQLVGPGATIDAAKKRVTGPLVAGGQDTGIKIEVRAGGPAVGFESTPALMYKDRTITLGMLQSDEIIAASKTQPVLGVVAPMDIDPQILLWSPQAHPTWRTIADIGQTDTKVLYFGGLSYMEYLVRSGILRASQVDSSYDGSPERFVSSGGKIVAQGYATNEPYLYEHEVTAWRKPVAYELVVNRQYPNYGNVLAIRTDQQTQLARCLERLVPLIQQAQVDFMRNPKKTVDLILELVPAYKSGFRYSRGLADFAVQQMHRLDIVSNGNDRTLGNFDMTRLTDLVGKVRPIFESQNKPIKPNITAADVATNKYINPAIGLPT